MKLIKQIVRSAFGETRGIEERWLAHARSYPTHQSKPQLSPFDYSPLTNNWLRRIGQKFRVCRQFSGYFLPRPLPHKEFEIWETEGRSNSTVLPTSLLECAVHENYLHFHPIYKSRRSFILEVPNGSYHVQDHTLFDQKLNPIDWEPPYWVLRCGLPGSMFRSRLGRATHLRGKALILATPGADTNFWHFLYDALPKLKLLQEAEIQINSFDHIIVNSRLLPYQQEAFAKLGIDQNKIVQNTKTPLIQADLVTHVTLGCLLPPDPWVLEWLRSSFLLTRGRSLQPRKIFISRESAGSRRLSCEQQLLQQLPSDITVLRLEEMTLQEQIQSFQNASVVISPHGAGLTNLVWCQPGTKVVELFSSSYKGVCYWMVSNHLRLDYAYAIGDESPSVDTSGVGIGILNPKATKSDIHFDNVALLAEKIRDFIK